MDEIQIKSTCAGGFVFSTDDPHIEYSASQKSNVIDKFDSLLSTELFDNIVEIGTYQGGLTIILDAIKKKHDLTVKIHTFDPYIWDLNIFATVQDKFLQRDVRFLQLDACNEEGSLYIKHIFSLGKTCLLCDAYKIKEFNKFAEYLKPGDFIMAHDYSKDGNKHGWEWIEIMFGDIKENVTKNNLVIYDKIAFDDAVWACFYKPI